MSQAEITWLIDHCQSDEALCQLLYRESLTQEQLIAIYKKTLQKGYDWTAAFAWHRQCPEDIKALIIKSNNTYAKEVLQAIERSAIKNK